MNDPTRGTPGSRPLDAPLDTAELELAALHALGALPPDELEACEREHRDHAAFWAEVRSLRDAAASVAAAGPRARPRRDLLEQVRALIAARAGQTHGARPSAEPPVQPWKRWEDGAPNPHGVRLAGETDFEPAGVAGISVRRLAVDPEENRITMLVRMEPGSAYPAHRHGGPEECYVLEGDLTVGEGIELSAGDFQRMERESVHAVQSTRGGCLLLITSSRRDELCG